MDDCQSAVISVPEAFDLLGSSVILQLHPSSLLTSASLADLQVRGTLVSMDPTSGSAILLSHSSSVETDKQSNQLRIIFGHAIASIEYDTLNETPPKTREELDQILESVSVHRHTNHS
ncbi:hypothetical protein HDU79_010615 [Rhizoclosmatium sp. JEL0117]|nr:hypothetical protein HDU79_010615 [Rhizoclosmatium sp. JEL0117]